MTILVATGKEVLHLDVDAGGTAGRLEPSHGLQPRLPTCLAADPRRPGRAWCGTHDDGVLRSEDGGRSWRPAGLPGRRIMAVAASPAADDLAWAGTEPSELWRSRDGGDSWQHMETMEHLPSSSAWAFPPRPETHHVRWIAGHPSEPGRVWVAIEAGALVATADGGVSWRDRVQGGPYDTHELAVHPAAPETLRVSAGDGYYQSADGGATWTRPMDGLEVGYLRSVVVDPGDPETVVVSASSGPRSAYAAGRSDGRIYRRRGDQPWRRVREGWRELPGTIAPLLAAGAKAGEMWAADESGLHRSEDGGVSWRLIAAFPRTPLYLRGLVVLLRG